MRTAVVTLAALALAAMPARAAEPLTLYAAGSLKAALGDVARAFAETYGTEVATEFAASGLLRGRIEGGARPDVFASANTARPQKLAADGRGGPVVLSARNRLCARSPGPGAGGDSGHAAPHPDMARRPASTPDRGARRTDVGGEAVEPLSRARR